MLSSGQLVNLHNIRLDAANWFLLFVFFVVFFSTKGLVSRVFGKQSHKKHSVCVCVYVYVYVLGAMKLCLTSPCRNQEMVREENVGVIDGNNPKILFIYLF